MNIERLREHRGFIFCALAAFLVSLLTAIFTGQLQEDAELLLGQAETLAREVEVGVQELSAREADSAARLKRLEQDLLPKWRAQVELELPEGFHLGAAESNPGFFFSQRLETQRRELREKADRVNFAYPQDLGFVEGAAVKDVPEQLVRLHLVSLVLGQAIADGLGAASEIAYPQTRYDELAPSRRVLRRIGVELALHGRLEAFERLQRALSQQGRFVALRQFRLEPAGDEAVGQAGEPPLRGRLVLDALSLLDERPTAATGPAEPGGQKRPPWRRR